MVPILKLPWWLNDTVYMKSYKVILLFLLYWCPQHPTMPNICLLNHKIYYLHLYKKFNVAMLWSRTCPFLTKWREEEEQTWGGEFGVFLTCIISLNHKTMETRATDLILQLKNWAFKHSSDLFQILTATGLERRSSNSGVPCSFHIN